MARRHDKHDRDERKPSRSDDPPERPGSLQALPAWGWSEEWGRKARTAIAALDGGGEGKGGGASAHLVPARVVSHVHHSYGLIAAPGAERMSGEVSGAFSYRVASPADYPTAGDWVVVDRESGRIHTVLPRRTAVRRAAAGKETLEQVILANVDLLFLVFGLDGGRNFTVGLLERALVAAWESGARPVVVLNKVDCTTPEEVEAARYEAEAHAPGVPVHAVSALRGDLLPALLNAFADRGDGMHPARVGTQRAGDHTGRHTTSDKQLYLLPSGAVMADVPGLRELQLWAEVCELAGAFPEIEALAQECRFNDCAHGSEPGCRVRQALTAGELAPERFERYLEYQRELSYLERRRDERAAAEDRKKWKAIAREQRQIKKRRE